jgi:prolipoprotein diacylglyceryltransferase
VQTPGLILLVGLWVGLYLSEKAANKYNFDAGNLYTLAFLILVSTLIGARLIFVLEYPQAFIANPLSLISINTVLFNWWGGAAVALMAAFWYMQRENLRFWLTLDILTPVFATLGIFIGIAHLASGSGYGIPSDLPWAIDLWGKYRHPTQIYEFISACIVSGLIFAILRSKKPIAEGITFLSFLIFTSFSRIFLETFRAESQLASNIRITQLLAWVILAVSLWLFGKRLTSE